MAFRPEFRKALTLLARGIQSMSEKGLDPPILVGGAAVELYTASAVTSGDFDLVTPFQKALEDALIPLGFERPKGPGVLLGGLIHPEFLIALQVVSGRLMDGATDMEKLVVVDIEGYPLRVIPIEDLIADRLGQAYSADPPRPDMLEQALILYQFADEYDADYLDRRISEETLGSADLVTLRNLK